MPTLESRSQAQLGACASRLAPLVEEARLLKAESRGAGMRRLEKDCDALAQSLEAARRKLASAS